MKIKIISDGTYENTRIMDAETGETLENVTFVSWSAYVDQPAVVMLHVAHVPVELSATEILIDGES